MQCSLTGWVKNLADGRVEVFACGDSQLLNEFEKWLQAGPDLAQVDHLEVKPAAIEHYDGFQILK